MSTPVHGAKCNPVELAELGIKRHALECEDALRKAVFAEREVMPGIATGLRMLAAYHSDQAFAFAAQLAHAQGGAA